MATIITIKTKTFTVPTEWNELTAGQLLEVCTVLYGEYPVSYGHLMLLKIITGAGTPFWNSLKPADVEEFLYIGEHLVNNTRLTKQILPFQRVRCLFGHKTFAPPADNFDNLRMSEFVFTEDYFFKFKEDETDLQWLDKLCAVLFRPLRKRYNWKINPDGDVREPFKESQCLYYAKRYVRKWPLTTKLSILTWYEHCRLQLVEDWPDVFKGGEGDPAKYGLVTMMRNVAQAGTHGTFEVVENLPLKLVMIELDELLAEAERLENLQPKTTN
jgi:hypothetical protein